MYGCDFRLRPRAGQEHAMLAVLERWERERRPKLEGFVRSQVYRAELHPGEYLVATVFTDRETYRKMSAHPDQDAWYCELRSLLESDPEWHDGEVVLFA